MTALRVAAALLVSSVLSGQTLKTLYTFGHGKFGSQPANGGAVGTNGELFGVTFRGGKYGVGVAFELAPPTSPGSAWAPFSCTSSPPQKVSQAPD